MTYQNLFAPMGAPLPDFKDGDEVHCGNLCQAYDPAGPVLIDGGKRVLFIGCNLVNCKTTIPSVDCNTYYGQIELPQENIEEVV